MANDVLSGSDARKYLSIAEAARKLGTSDKTVRRLIKDGSLVARQFGGKGKKWFIPVEAIDAPANPGTSSTFNPQPVDIHRSRPRCGPRPMSRAPLPVDAGGGNR